MVEEVFLKKKVNSTVKDIELGKIWTFRFYFWNINLYLISLLTFDSMFIKVFFYLTIISFIFRFMFGLARNTRYFIINFIISLIYLFSLEFFLWQFIILILTTYVNYQYYYRVLKK